MFDDLAGLSRRNSHLLGQNVALRRKLKNVRKDAVAYRRLRDFVLFGKMKDEVRTAQAERDKAVAERDAAVAEAERCKDLGMAGNAEIIDLREERDRAIAERDRAVAERDALYRYLRSRGYTAEFLLSEMSAGLAPTPAPAGEAKS